MALSKRLDEPPPTDDAGDIADGAAPTAAAEASDPSRRNEMIEIVRGAIEAGRVDLYLQPIVTLPQRKVRYYEAITRLRTEGNELLQPADFLHAAEAGGLMPKIDNLLVFRSVQVVRRLQLKNRDIGLFCNISESTLNHPRSVSANPANSWTPTARSRRRWCWN